MEAKERNETLKLDGKLNTDFALFKKFSENRINLYWSIWGFWELNQKIREQLFQKKCILYGYQMPKEYYEALDEVPPLNESELEVYNKTMNALHAAILPPKRIIHEIDMQKIMDMVNCGCDFVDAILFFHAYINGCDFFITRDKKFKECVKPFCQKNNLEIRISNPDFFLKILNKEDACWECGGDLEIKECEVPNGNNHKTKIVKTLVCKDCGSETKIKPIKTS